MSEPWITPYEVREALREAVVNQARFAAEFTCSAGNFDRTEEQKGRPHEYPNPHGGPYDLRWYPVHNALDGFTSGLDAAIESALHRLERTAYALGVAARKESHQ